MTVRPGDEASVQWRRFSASLTAAVAVEQLDSCAFVVDARSLDSPDTRGLQSASQSGSQAARNLSTDTDKHLIPLAANRLGCNSSPIIVTCCHWFPLARSLDV